MATARMAGTARPPNCRRTSNTLAPIAYSAIDRGEAPTHLTSCSAFPGPGACQGLIASDETRLLPDHLTWWRLAAIGSSHALRALSGTYTNGLHF